MMCMAMQTFLESEIMPSHGELLTARLVRPVTPHDAVHFISHEWLSRTHPDPDSVQLRRMQAVFQEVAAGRCPMLFTAATWEMFRTGKQNSARGQALRRELQLCQAMRLSASAFAQDVEEGMA